MKNTFEIENYKGYRINVIEEEEYNPREIFENVGTMVCSHPRYNLGDIQYDNNYDWIRSFANYFMEKYSPISDNYLKEACDLSDKGISKIWKYIKKNCTILTLSLYDHSGLRISCYDAFNKDSLKFDSMTIGYIYVLNSRAQSMGILNKNLKDILILEVKNYDAYVSNEIFSYKIEDSNGKYKYTDSSIYFGLDFKELYKDAKKDIDSLIKRNISKHIKELKIKIKNSVPLKYRKSLKQFKP